jgi:hypothetical protein
MMEIKNHIQNLLKICREIFLTICLKKATKK